MLHVNWKDLEPWPGYRNTCFERDLLAAILPTDEARERFASYLNWAKVITVVPGRTMRRHAHNHGEFIYVLDGKGTIEAGGIERQFGPRDSFQVPAGIPHCFANPDETQALTMLSLGWLPEGGTPAVEDVPAGEGDARPNKQWFQKQNLARALEVVEGVMRPIAEAHGCTLAQLTLAWTIAAPGITCALAGARNAEQAAENAGAMDIELSEDEHAEILAAFEALGEPQ